MLLLVLPSWVDTSDLHPSLRFAIKLGHDVAGTDSVATATVVSSESFEQWQKVDIAGKHTTLLRLFCINVFC